MPEQNAGVSFISGSKHRVAKFGDNGLANRVALVCPIKAYKCDLAFDIVCNQSRGHRLVSLSSSR
jgi:hypothetical protein